MSELQQVLDSIAELRTDFTSLRSEFTELKADVKTFDTKFDNYQKATQWVVNLAFSLIASATIVTLASSIFRR